MVAGAKAGFTSTGVASLTTVVTGLGFRPKAMAFATLGVTGDGGGTGTGNHGISRGFSDGTNHCYVAWQGDSAVSPTNVNRYLSTTKCIRIMNGVGGATFYEATVAFDDDGFTLTWNAVPNLSSLQFEWEAYGGNDITNVAVGTLTCPTTVTTLDVNVGFVPDFGMFLCSSQTAVGAAAGANMSWGYARSSSKETCGAICVADAQTMATAVNAINTVRNNATLYGLIASTGLVDFAADLVSFDQGGAGTTFRLNFSDAPAAAYLVPYMVIKGGLWDVGTMTAPTGDSSVTGVGFLPDLVGVSGAGMASTATAGVVNTLGTEAISSFGACVGGTNTGGTTPATGGHVKLEHSDDVTTIVRRSQASALIASPFAVQQALTLKSRDSDGFTVTSDTGGAAPLNVVWGWYACQLVAGPPTHLGAATLAGTTSLSATGATTLGAAATLAGAATVNATGTVPVIHQATATLAGTSTVTGTLRQQHEAAATLVGTSAGLNTGTVTRLATATLAGAATTSFTAGEVTRLGAGTLAGVSAVSPIGTVTRLATATLGGAGVVDATGQSGPASVTHLGQATLAGTSTTAGTGTIERTATAILSGAATTSLTGQVTRLASALLAGQGLVTTVEQVTRLGAALLTGQATVSATGNVGGTSAATISGTSNFVINGITGGGYVPPRVISVTPAGGGTVVTVTWTASQPVSSPYYYLEIGLDAPGGGLYGADALNPATVYVPANDTWVYYFTVQARVGGQWQDFYDNPFIYNASPRQAQSTLGGSGVVGASAGVTSPAQATIAGTGAVVAVGSVSGVQDGAATLAGTGAVLATGTRTVSATALLSGQGTVAPTGQVTRLAVTALAGAGTVSATGQREALGVATLAGTSTVVATGTVQQAALLGAATIAGTATVSATGAVASVRLGGATLAGTSTVFATGTVQHLILAIATIAGTATVTATGRVSHRSFGDTGGRETLFELLSWDGVVDELITYTDTRDFLQLVE